MDLENASGFLGVTRGCAHRGQARASTSQGLARDGKFLGLPRLFGAGIRYDSACAATNMWPRHLSPGEELWLQQIVTITPRLSQATRGTYERLDLSDRTNRRHHGNSIISRIALGEK